MMMMIGYLTKLVDTDGGAIDDDCGGWITH